MNSAQIAARIIDEIDAGKAPADILQKATAVYPAAKLSAAIDAVEHELANRAEEAKDKNAVFRSLVAIVRPVMTARNCTINEAIAHLRASGEVESADRATALLNRCKLQDFALL